MSKKHQNPLKKEKRKLKRNKNPITPNDHLENFLIDYKNFLRRKKFMENNLEKMAWEAHQMKDALMSIMEKVKFKEPKKEIEDV